MQRVRQANFGLLPQAAIIKLSGMLKTCRTIFVKCDKNVAAMQKKNGIHQQGELSLFPALRVCLARYFGLETKSSTFWNIHRDPHISDINESFGNKR